LIRIAVVGFGYWGPNLARNLLIPDRSELVAICDTDPKQTHLAGTLYPNVRISRSAEETIEATDVDAIALATPAQSHFELALAALKAGKHVLISKPMTETSEQAAKLIEEANRRSSIQMLFGKSARASVRARLAISIITTRSGPTSADSARTLACCGIWRSTICRF